MLFLFRPFIEVLADQHYLVRTVHLDKVFPIFYFRRPLPKYYWFWWTTFLPSIPIVSARFLTSYAESFCASDNFKHSFAPCSRTTNESLATLLRPVGTGNYSNFLDKKYSLWNSLPKSSEDPKIENEINLVLYLILLDQILLLILSALWQKAECTHFAEYIK